MPSEPGIVGRPKPPSSWRVPALLANRSRTLAGGPMNVRSWARDDLGEALVLGQEAVARVDRVAAGHERGRDDRRGRQVRALRVRRADADRLVGEADRRAIAIGLAVGDDRLDAERAAGAQDPERDLAAVGDEDLAEHQASRPVGRRRPTRAVGRGRAGANSMTRSSWPYSTASPGSTRLEPDDAVDRRHDLLGDAEHVDGAEPVAGADPGAGRQVRRAAGRCRRPARSRRRATRSGPSSPRADDGAVARRPVAAAGRVAALRAIAAARAAGSSRSALRAGRGRVAGRPAQADPPATLADLELAEAGRAELGDERRQQLVGQAVDGGVIGRALGGAADVVGPRASGGGDRALARPPRGLAARRATSPRSPGAMPRRAGIEQVAEPIRQATVDAFGDFGLGGLSVGAQRPVAPVARVEQLVEGQLRRARRAGRR